jgi:hypothetical protein
MRVNVYTEELLPITSLNPVVCEIVHTEYVSSRTNQPMRNYGVRIFLESSPKLHYVEGRDDDRSAITFWCGPTQEKCFDFLKALQTMAKHSTHEPRSWG